MTKQKRKPRIGDEAWRVEWISELAFYEGTEEIDRDACKESSRAFSTWEAALAFANKIWPTTTDKFGIVEITPIRFAPYDEDEAGIYPHVGFWEDSGDSKIISDDSGHPE